MDNATDVPDRTIFTTMAEPINALLTFTWIDYTLFSAMFAISALIGVYFGCFGSKQATTKEYLLGGKSMSIFPIAMSLIARFVLLLHVINST